MRFVSDDQYVMAGYSQGLIQTWQINTGESVKTFYSDQAVQTAIGLTREGFIYATLDSGGRLTIWEKTK
jgi:hypothetical protein